MADPFLASRFGRDLFGQLVKIGPGGGSPQGRQLTFLDALAEGAAEPRVQVPAWMERVCKAMDADINGLPTADKVGQRWAAILERRAAHLAREAVLRGDTRHWTPAKLIAVDLEVQVRTAQSWLAGQVPYLIAAVEAALKWRDPSVLFELAGLAPPDEAGLERELAGLRQDLATLGARIARLKGAP